MLYAPGYKHNLAYKHALLGPERMLIESFYCNTSISSISVSSFLRRAQFSTEGLADIAHQTLSSHLITLLAAMDPIFCCSQIQPYMARRLDHELKFEDFLAWAQELNSESSIDEQDHQTVLEQGSLVVQIVRQVNYGPLESKRYFVKTPTISASGASTFREINENDLIQANFQKLNS
jgi:hypothetical protein